MAVDTFTREEFEAALPVHCKTREQLWQHVGLVDGEHAYMVKPFPARPYAVHVRSSVHGDNRSAASGEDSIRAWIVTDTGAPFGSKLSRYVTRVPGWQDRLTLTLRRLAQMIREIQPCECCGQDCPTFKASKQAKNPGKLFAKCVNRECRKPSFRWLPE